VEPAGEAEVDIGGKRVRIRRGFFEDLRQARVLERAAGLGRALLVLHSPRDEVVPLSDGLELFTAAVQPKSFVSLDDADHLLSSEADALYVGSVIAAWASRYVGSGLRH
jgi:putative redox protein